MAGRFQGIEDMLRVAYPARLLDDLFASVPLAPAGKAGEAVADDPRWTIEVYTAVSGEEVDFLFGSWSSANSAVGHVQALLKGAPPGLLRRDPDGTFTWYPASSIVKLRARTYDDFEKDGILAA